MNKRSRNSLMVLLTVLALALTGCATPAQAQTDDPPADTPKQETPAADGHPPPGSDAEDEPAPVQPAQQAPPDPAVVSVLNQIEAASSEIQTLKARVRYTRLQTLTGDQQRRYGDFYYDAGSDDKPTLFAVLFDRLIVDGKARPMKTWFIFDGNWLLERDHDDKTATRRELVPKGAERSDTLSLGGGQMPIPLRLKADEVLETYRVQRLKDEPFGEDQILIRLRLTPKGAGQAAEPMDLWFDKKTLMLHKVVTTEDADEIELLFPASRYEVNAEIEKGTFDTKLPKKQDGWQVQDVPLEG